MPTLAIRFSSFSSCCICQAFAELTPYRITLVPLLSNLPFLPPHLLELQPSALLGIHVPPFHGFSGLLVTVYCILLLRFVSRWVGKAKAVDLTFCPWCCKLTVDPPSTLTFPRTLLFKLTSNTQSEWHQQHTSQQSLTVFICWYYRHVCTFQGYLRVIFHQVSLVWETGFKMVRPASGCQHDVRRWGTRIYRCSIQWMVSLIMISHFAFSPWMTESSHPWKNLCTVYICPNPSSAGYWKFWQQNQQEYSSD